MAIDVGPNRAAVGKFGGYRPQGMGQRPPNPMGMGGPPRPNPGMGGSPINVGPSMPPPSPMAPPPMGPPPPPMALPPMTPSSFTGNQQGGGFLPGGTPPTGPQSMPPPPPMMPPPQTGGIDTAPVGYVDPNKANVPNISMGTMGGQGASRMGGLRNAYAGAGPNLSTQSFRNKLFY